MAYTKEMALKEYQREIDRVKNLEGRIAELKITDEKAIIVERIDLKKIGTFLHTDPAASRDNIRTSWYGRILAISDVDSGDPITETQKKNLKVGDCVLYNPDVAFSLNLDSFYEAWVIGVMNVICIDTKFDYLKMLKDSLDKRVEMGF